MSKNQIKLSPVLIKIFTLRSKISQQATEGLQTWWKGSSLYSFFVGGQTGVPPPSPSEEKEIIVLLSRRNRDIQFTSAQEPELQIHFNKTVTNAIFSFVYLVVSQAHLFFWPVSEVQDDLHSAQCRKSSHIRSSVSDSCRVLSESCVLRLEHLELQLVPDLGTSWQTHERRTILLFGENWETFLT